MYCLSAEQLTTSRFAGASIRLPTNSYIVSRPRPSACLFSSFYLWEVAASIVLLITVLAILAPVFYVRSRALRLRDAR